jgi:hypothetical protein
MTVVVGKFPPGRIRITPGVKSVLSQNEAIEGLVRHLTGDWGDLDEHDWKENQAALEHGFTLRSRYVTPAGTTFGIITEHDRSVTTIFLPGEN